MTPDEERQALRRARWTLAVLGIIAPYLARLPGIPTHGLGWLTSYFGDHWIAPLFFGAFNAVAWVPAVLLTLTYRHPQSVWFPAIGLVGSSLWLHSLVDLSADAQAAIALVVLPFYTLPFTATGWLLGHFYDRRLAARRS